MPTCKCGFACLSLGELESHAARAGHAYESPTNSAIDHPSHYTAGGIETIDAIEAWGLGFNLGNAVKYISRAGKKDPAKTLEDLRKAAWYVAREISNLER